MRRADSARPGRAADHGAEIAAPEGWVLVREHIGLDVAEGRLGLVPDAVVERLDDVLLEAGGARMRRDDRRALGIAVLGVAEAEHVHLDAGGDERGCRGSRVQVDASSRSAPSRRGRAGGRAPALRAAVLVSDALSAGVRDVRHSPLRPKYTEGRGLLCWDCGNSLALAEQCRGTRGA